MIPLPAAPVASARHPCDPEPVRSTKARTVFALGVVAAVAGLFIGGVVPAVIAFSLARQARREAYASGGYLTGAAWLQSGERLAWVGIVLAATSLVAAVVIAVVGFSTNPLGHDFAPTID